MKRIEEEENDRRGKGAPRRQTSKAAKSFRGHRLIMRRECIAALNIVSTATVCCAFTLTTVS